MRHKCIGKSVKKLNHLIQRYDVTGVGDGVTIRVITDGKDIITAYPMRRK